MSATPAPADGVPARDGAGHCEIRLKGHLDARWSDWFGGLRLTRESDGTTVLRGPVTDQAALHGLLRKVRDLGLPLLSVTHAETERGGMAGDTTRAEPHSNIRGKTEPSAQRNQNMKANVHADARAAEAPRLDGVEKPAPQRIRRPARAGAAGWREWWVPLALILLCAIPLAAGTVRLVSLASGAVITAENARFFAAPLPVVLHIVAAAAYIVLGAFQFVPGFRRRMPGWHRRVGRLVVGAGLVAALSALWMTHFYALPAHDGLLLYWIRLLFGSLMAISIVLGLVAIRRREISRHRAWMVRGYALGLAAGTQVLTLGIGEVVLGPPGEVARALLMGAAWAINLALAEWIIRRRLSPPARTPRTASPVRPPGYEQELGASAPAALATRSRNAPRSTYSIAHTIQPTGKKAKANDDSRTESPRCAALQ